MSVSRRRLLQSGAALAGGFGLMQIAGCGPASVQTSGKLAPVRDISGQWSLKSIAAERGLLAGFAVDPSQLKNARYAQIVKGQSSIIVAENAMKWDALRPAPGQFNFDETDSLLTFSEQTHIKLRGHTLCWHRALPKWVDAISSSAEVHALLVEHIRTVAGRYTGRMHSWDVVNEAVEVKDGRPDSLRNSFWLRQLGSEYIETAFQTARLADPSALLTYNDYGIEDETYDAEQKRSAILLLLRRLKARNVPIDAVGIQCHLTARAMYNYGPGLRRFIARVGELGLQVFLSEMDVNDRNLEKTNASRDDGVAEAYSKFLRNVLMEPAIKAILFWGVDDAQSWLTAEQPRRDGEPQRPLLFDRDYRPKEAFYSVRSAIEART